MIVNSALTRSCRPLAHHVQRRSMAVKKWADMAVKKNKFVEEWNGQREITEKSFEVGVSQVPTLVLYVILFPYGVYTLTRNEFKLKGDRRHEDLF